jgi:Na+-transporting NADH:ubiquinone oxidoreductase subunit C
MNTNSNTYTVIYSTVLVMVVAAVLAFAAEFLKPAQETNVKQEAIGQIIKAASIEGADVLSTYSEQIEKAILVNGSGEVVGELATDRNNIKVYSTSDLKKQTKITNPAELELPVYVFKNGITVVPCYGPGLWGPIWGYVGFEKDLNTISRAVFDHKGETPGLGDKITKPVFYEQFPGKTLGTNGEYFKVMKTGTASADNEVDAISGATITSKAMGKTLNQWFGFYASYFKNNKVEE